jgi:hypothetical protein
VTFIGIRSDAIICFDFEHKILVLYFMTYRCAKDCGPCKCMCVCNCACAYEGYAGIHTSKHKLQQFFKDHALIFFFNFQISTGEESNQPTKHANKIIIPIFCYEVHNPLHTLYDTVKGAIT